MDLNHDSSQEPETNENLNLLVAAIDEMEAEENYTNNASEQEMRAIDRGTAETLSQGESVISNGEAQEVLSPRRRPLVVRQYISSSSAKRRIKKKTHCHFCDLEIDKMNFRNHLLSVEECRILYCRKLRVKEVNAVIVLSFQCIFCNQHVRQLASHLKSAPECLQNFVQLFELDEGQEIDVRVKNVMTKVQNLKRSGYKSRQSLKRAFENASAAANKRKKRNNEPMETFCNALLRDTTYLNYKKCANCLCNLTSAVDVDEESEVCVTGLFDFKTLEANKRMEKIWLCQFCMRNEDSTIKKSIFKIVSNMMEDKVVYHPVLKDEDGKIFYFLFFIFYFLFFIFYFLLLIFFYFSFFIFHFLFSIFLSFIVYYSFLFII